MRSLIAVAAIAALAGCSGGSGGGGTGPQNGTLQISTSTAGTDLDADGYFYSVDGGTPVAIASGGTASVSKPAGNHTVVFSGIAANCSMLSPTTTTFNVSAGQTVIVALQVGCQVRYSVHAGTSGSDQDVAYLVNVDGGPWHLLLANGTPTPLSGTSVGPHMLNITGVAPNCVLTGAASRVINVPDAGVDDPIAVTCSATARKILFGTTRNAGYDLYLMNPDGSSQTRLTTGVAVAHGRYSPDGSKIVCNGLTGGVNVDIYVMNFDGSGIVGLTTDGNANVFPDWSPDGSKIVWQKNNSIWVMDAAGTNQRMLRATGSWPRWSPDGNQILFTDAAGVQVVMRMNADGSNVVTLTDGGGSGAGFASWSPDGKKILFQSGSIWTMNADGTGPVNLFVVGFGEPAEYSPDGQYIAYATYVSGSQDLRRMDATGSNGIDLVTGSADDFGPAWHP